MAAREVDSDYTELDDQETDSALGDEISVLTQSVCSSVYEYQYENGRRYHAVDKGQYLLPNDEREQDRLDLLHHLFKLVLDGALYTAPLQSHSLHTVLDIGTGTGIWAIDMADEYPAANVIATDISPIQPSWVPPNCHFQIDDVETEWTFAETFDYIHIRTPCGSITDWPRFYQRAFDNLKPGAWIEMQDHECWLHSDDDSMEKALWSRSWIQQVDIASSRIGGRFNVAHLHRQWMLDTGLIDVSEDVYKIPIGPWPKDKRLKEFGRVQRVQMMEAVPSFSLALYTQVLGYSEVAAQAVIARVKAELTDPTLHLYSRWHFVRGRKPHA